MYEQLSVQLYGHLFPCPYWNDGSPAVLSRELPENYERYPPLPRSHRNTESVTINVRYDAFTVTTSGTWRRVVRQRGTKISDYCDVSFFTWKNDSYEAGSIYAVTLVLVLRHRPVSKHQNFQPSNFLSMVKRILIMSLEFLSTWIWRQRISPKNLFLSTRLHGVKELKNNLNTLLTNQKPNSRKHPYLPTPWQEKNIKFQAWHLY